jgi:crotonobetainyl-CoA:carnitine CoA-transferase CaiB-like acyl-CoA transferase
VVDISGANLAAIGILSALYRRNQTGTGEHIQLSLLEAAYALMPNYLVSVLNGDPQFKRQGSGHPQLVPYQAFKAGDGKYIVIGAFHRSSWLAFCKALEREDLTQMPQFKDNWDRVKNRHELVAILENELRRRSSTEWLKLFKQHQVLASPVLTIKESFETFSKLIPGLIAESSHGKLGKVRMLRPPIRFTGNMDEPPLSAAPVLGQHTQERLAKAGHSQEEIRDWQAKGIV